MSSLCSCALAVQHCFEAILHFSRMYIFEHGVHRRAGQKGNFKPLWKQSWTDCTCLGISVACIVGLIKLQNQAALLKVLLCCLGIPAEHFHTGAHLDPFLNRNVVQFYSHFAAPQEDKTFSAHIVCIVYLSVWSTESGFTFLRNQI